MRYRIVHLIEGEAKEYLENLSRVFSSFYRLRPPTSNIDPHLTVKSPFDALSSDLFDIEQMLDRYARSKSPSTYTLKGFGSFDDRVVYMGGEATDETTNFFLDLKSELKRIPWLDFKPHEDNNVLHSSIVFPRTPEQTKEMVDKLNEKGTKTFECTLNKVSLMKKGERRWESYKEYKIGSDGLEPLTFTEV